MKNLNQYRRCMWIEGVLRCNEIRPGPKASKDKRAPGNLYLSYRNDKNLELEYVPATELTDRSTERVYNQEDQDPFINFRVNISSLALYENPMTIHTQNEEDTLDIPLP